MILVTHHISMCLSSASYIVELGAGKVILQGDVKELQASGKVKTVIDTQDETANADDDEVEVTPINEADADTSKSEVPKRTRSFNGKLIEAEHREEGRVSIATYLNYSKFNQGFPVLSDLSILPVRSAGTISWILIVVLAISTRLITIGNDVSEENRIFIIKCRIHFSLLGVPREMVGGF